jgi:hypothetical protein
LAGELTKLPRFWGYISDLVNGVNVAVVTNTHGKSRYAIVERFVGLKDNLFALVTWLSVPHYPFAPNPLVVTVRRTHIPDVRLSPVLFLRDIVPTKVAVEPCDDGIHFNMLRERGTDCI